MNPNNYRFLKLKIGLVLNIGKWFPVDKPFKVKGFIQQYTFIWDLKSGIEIAYYGKNKVWEHRIISDLSYHDLMEIVESFPHDTLEIENYIKLCEITYDKAYLC